MDDRTKILTFWAAGSGVMLLMSGIIAAGTWFVGLMSAPETIRLEPVGAPSAPPEGGTRQSAPDEDETGDLLPADITGLTFRKDKARTPVWNRRIHGDPVYLRLPHDIPQDSLKRVVDCLNRVAELVEEPQEAPRLRVVK